MTILVMQVQTFWWNCCSQLFGRQIVCLMNLQLEKDADRQYSWLLDNHGSCSTVAFTVEKYLRISGPAQFKCVLFKGQLYYWHVGFHWLHLTKYCKKNKVRKELAGFQAGVHGRFETVVFSFCHLVLARFCTSKVFNNWFYFCVNRSTDSNIFIFDLSALQQHVKI